MRVVLILMATFQLALSEEDGAFSFQKFRGPVSGQIREVVVPGHYPNQAPRVDYVAQPDYLYSYGVVDPESGNSQAHRETRHGDAVTGEYRVLQADGVTRIVKYTADGQHGFRATVHYEK